jgi:hypothetical protein
MRRFLYSKWFFLTLAIVCGIDLFTDVADEIWGWSILNKVSIVADIGAVSLSLWIFRDLHSRRPKGDDTRRRG